MTLRRPAKTEAHRGSSTLRAAGAPHRGSCATAASGGRDSDLDIWGATRHRVPWRDSVPSCFILSLVLLKRWLRSFSGRVTAVLPAVNSLHQLLEASQVLLTVKFGHVGFQKLSATKANPHDFAPPGSQEPCLHKGVNTAHSEVFVLSLY